MYAQKPERNVTLFRLSVPSSKTLAELAVSGCLAYVSKHQGGFGTTQAPWARSECRSLIHTVIYTVTQLRNFQRSFYPDMIHDT